MSGELRLLTTVANEAESEMVSERLSDVGIRCMPQLHPDNIRLGPAAPLDIYVEAGVYDDALDALAGEVLSEEELAALSQGAEQQHGKGPARALSAHLMFGGEASAAIDLYVEALGAEVEQLVRYGPGEQGAEGTVMHARLLIAGSSLTVIDSPVEHPFSFTPAVSLLLEYDDAETLRAAWARLADGGSVLMELDRYPFSELFGWLTDRHGVSWQFIARPAA